LCDSLTQKERGAGAIGAVARSPDPAAPRESPNIARCLDFVESRAFRDALVAARRQLRRLEQRTLGRGRRRRVVDGLATLCGVDASAPEGGDYIGQLKIDGNRLTARLPEHPPLEARKPDCCALARASQP
jgi:hypothetical protein